MIVLDTNVISEVFKPKPDTRVVAWLESATGDIAITAITLAELLAGVRRLPDDQRKAELMMAIDAALEPYRASGAVLAFDESVVDHYADILVTRERIGRPISMADAQIAAICRFHGAVCATRNSGDFAHTGIDLIDPWLT
jgi:predicted nucleic acid-binding protein